MNEMIKDEQFIQKQIDCVLDDSDDKCGPFGRQLKRKPCHFSKNLLVHDPIFFRIGP